MIPSLIFWTILVNLSGIEPLTRAQIYQCHHNIATVQYVSLPNQKSQHNALLTEKPNSGWWLDDNYHNLEPELYVYLLECEIMFNQM